MRPMNLPDTLHARDERMHNAFSLCSYQKCPPQPKLRFLCPSSIHEQGRNTAPSTKRAMRCCLNVSIHIYDCVEVDICKRTPKNKDTHAWIRAFVHAVHIKNSDWDFTVGARMTRETRVETQSLKSNYESCTYGKRCFLLFPPSCASTSTSLFPPPSELRRVGWPAPLAGALSGDAEPPHSKMSGEKKSDTMVSHPRFRFLSGVRTLRRFAQRDVISQSFSVHVARPAYFTRAFLWREHQTKPFSWRFPLIFSRPARDRSWNRPKPVHAQSASSFRSHGARPAFRRLRVHP